MELSCFSYPWVPYQNQILEANVEAELKRLRTEEGYKIQILDVNLVSGEVNCDLLDKKSVERYRPQWEVNQDSFQKKSMVQAFWDPHCSL
jgi:hypothetical protein